VAFDALLTERSVSRAADRLGLTQPAMSHTLARLRAGVGDRLFEGTRHGIHPTPRALALAEPVRSAMATLRHALSAPGQVRPAIRTVTIAANEYAQAIVLPHVAKTLADAPKPVGLDVVRPERSATDVALTIDWTGDRMRPGGPKSATILRDEFVCILRRGHSEVVTKYTLNAFLEAAHVVVGAERARDPVDLALGAVEKERRIGVAVADFSTAAWLVSGSDLVSLVPRRFAALLAPALELRLLKPPLELDGLTLGVFWNRRSSEDQLTMWLKNRILEAGKL